MTINGYFQIIDWQESTVTEINNDTKLNKATVKTEYHGDIVGTSCIEYQLFYNNEKHASFIGYEHVSFSKSNDKKQLIVEHKGVFKNGIATATLSVLFSEHDDLVLGSSGTLRSDDHGKAEFSFASTP